MEEAGGVASERTQTFKESFNHMYFIVYSFVSSSFSFPESATMSTHWQISFYVGGSVTLQVCGLDHHTLIADDRTQLDFEGCMKAYVGSHVPEVTTRSRRYVVTYG